jgi:hypothetical protein
MKQVPERGYNVLRMFTKKWMELKAKLKQKRLCLKKNLLLRKNSEC